MKKIELRFGEASVTSDDGKMTVSGYVNETGKHSQVMGRDRKFVEKIAPGAFSRAIKNAKQGIDFLAEHSIRHILASTSNGSLRLQEDETGLYMEATIAQTTWGKDYYQLISEGLYQHMSFGFRAVKDDWKALGNGLFERTIHDLELYEVSVVRQPAYLESVIAARGMDVIENIEIPKELLEERDRMDEKQKELFDNALEEIRTVFGEFSEKFSEFSDKLEEKKAETTDNTISEEEIREIAKSVFIELREELKEEILQEQESEEANDLDEKSEEKEDKEKEEETSKEDRDSDEEDEEDREEDEDKENKEDEERSFVDEEKMKELRSKIAKLQK